MPVVEGKVSVAVTVSVGTRVVEPLVAAFNCRGIVYPLISVILSNIYKTTHLEPLGMVTVTPLPIEIGPTELALLPVGIE